MIAVADYGMGNRRSVEKALAHVGAESVVTADVRDATAIFEAGSLFTSNKVSVSGFTITFDFRLTSAAADGFAFVIQGVGSSALGTGGGGLGYQGIGSSVAVKFDLSDNAGEGSNSTGLYVNGAAPTGGAADLTPSGIDLHSGHVFRATVMVPRTAVGPLTPGKRLATWIPPPFVTESAVTLSVILMSCPP